jgi:dienelactone hydrolase
MLRIVCWAVVLCSQVMAFRPLPAFAQAVPTGLIVDQITAIADSNQSYALYLPSNYTPPRRWPAILVFDPAARGPRAVAVFQPAAEKYGYIVAASNTSRNGPWQPQFNAFQAMWHDLQERFTLDSARIYTAGFSGGARLAVMLTRACNGCIAGVIGVGAGFPSEVSPARPLNFVYFAAVGLYDFNFSEMLQLSSALDRQGSPNHLAIFSGGHEWFSPELAATAVEWLELRAMAVGRRPHEEAFITRQWNAAAIRAHKLELAGDFYPAYLEMKALAVDFSGLHDVTEAAAAAERLAKSAVVRKAEKEQSRQMQRQYELAGPLLAQLQELAAEPGERSAAVRDMRLGLDHLKARRGKAKSADEVAVLSRALGSVLVRALETGEQMLEEKRYVRAAAYFEVASAASARPAELHYKAATAYALAGERKQALAALKNALRAGFDNPARLRDDRALASLRDTREFRDLLQQVARGARSGKP